MQQISHIQRQKCIAMASLNDSLNCCRLCLTTEEDSKVYESLFSLEGNYIEKIYDICGIRIAPSEKKIEKKICTSCINDLNSASNFRLQVLDAYDYFFVMEGVVRGTVDKTVNDSSVDSQRSAPAGNSEVKNESSTSNNLMKMNPTRPQVEQEAGVMSAVVEIPSTKPLREPAKKANEEVSTRVPVKIKSAPVSSSSKRIRKVTTKLLESEEQETRKLKSMRTSSHNYEADGKVVEIEKHPTNFSSIQTEPQRTKVAIFRCGDCGCHYLSHFALKKHLDVHSSVNSLPCFFCPLKFNGNQKRLIHMQVQHTSKLAKLYAGDPI